MHQPRPHGKFGQEDATRDDMAFAESLMRHVTNIKQTAKLDSFKMVRALPTAAWWLPWIWGIVKTIIRKPKPEVVEDDELAEVSADVPMLFSGIVERTILRERGEARRQPDDADHKALGRVRRKEKEARGNIQHRSTPRAGTVQYPPYGPRFF